MVKKVKRKYTRHEKAVETVTDGVRLDYGVVDGATGVIIPIKGNGGFTFEDLPLSIQADIEHIIAYRKRLNLPDDSKERKQRAIEGEVIKESE